MEHFTRTPAGFYEFGNWSIGPTEGEFRSPGYKWFAHNCEGGDEPMFGQLAAAKIWVIDVESKALIARYKRLYKAKMGEDVPGTILYRAGWFDLLIPEQRMRSYRWKKMVSVCELLEKGT
jgi:hypothetical protein